MYATYLALLEACKGGTVPNKEVDSQAPDSIAFEAAVWDRMQCNARAYRPVPSLHLIPSLKY